MAKSRGLINIERLREAVSINVRSFDAKGDGVTDDTAAIQDAHNALPSGGGMLYFPDGTYLLGTNNAFADITKSKVQIIGSSGALIISPSSSDAEVITGTRYDNGFRFYGNDCAISVNMRGPSISWFPPVTTARFTVSDMVMTNLYRTGVNVSNAGFDLLNVSNVTFDTSRDLPTIITAGITNTSATVTYATTGNIFVGQVVTGTGIQPGTTVTVVNAGVGFTLSLAATATNASASLSISVRTSYPAIQRIATGSDTAGNLIRVTGCYFRGVAVGISANNIRDLVVTNGTRFRGCNQSTITMNTSNSTTVKQNLTIDNTTTIDGRAVDNNSVNRHVNCTGFSRPTIYVGFGLALSIVDRAEIHGKFYNFSGNYAIQYFSTSLTEAVSNFDGIEMEACTNAIVDPIGTVNMEEATFKTSNIVTSTSLSNLKGLSIYRCKFTDSSITLGKKCTAALTRYDIISNEVSYGIDNNGWLQISASFTDSVPIMWVDDNRVTLTNGMTVAMNLSTTGTKAWIGPNNKISTYTITGGEKITSYEPSTSGTNSLKLPLKDGKITITNTGAAGNLIYNINDATLTDTPIGSSFSFVQTHATNTLAFVSSGGKVGAGATTTATTASQNAGGVLLKVAASQWLIRSTSGTVNLT